MEAKTINDLEPAVRSEVDSLSKAIVDAFPDWIEQIYLFGSYAYGTPHEDSDLDLYVVLKDDVPRNMLDAGVEIRMAILYKQSMAVDIVTKKKKDFLDRLYNFTLEQKVTKKGMLIYG